MRALQVAAGVALAAAAAGPLIVAREILSRLGRDTDSTKLDVLTTGLLPFGLAILLLATSLAMLTRSWPPSARTWLVSLFAASAALPCNDWLSHGWILNVLSAAVAGLLGIGLLPHREDERTHPEAPGPRTGPLGR